MLQARAQLLAAEDQHSQLGELLVSSGVIAVDMGIDEKANRLVRDLLDRRDQPLGQRRAPIVDAGILGIVRHNANLAVPSVPDRGSTTRTR